MFKKFLVLQIVLAMTAATAFATGELAVLSKGGPAAIQAISSLGARSEIARVLKMPAAEITRINRLAPAEALKAIQDQIARVVNKSNTAEIEAQLSRVAVQYKIEFGNASVAATNTNSGFVAGSNQDFVAGNGAKNMVKSSKRPQLSTKTTTALGDYSKITRDLVGNVSKDVAQDIAAIASSGMGVDVISPKMPETCRKSKIVGEAANKLGEQYIYIANELSADGNYGKLTATQKAIRRSNGVLKGFTAPGRQYANNCAGAIKAGRILAEKAFDSVKDFEAGVNAEDGICPTTPPVIMSLGSVNMATCQLN